jgi:hypothetical protein
MSLSSADKNDSIRKVKGFFFPTNTERKIYLKLATNFALSKIFTQSQ